jgi:acyl dehydratase
MRDTIASVSFERPIFFDDYVEGQVYVFGKTVVSEDEIIEFAGKYDPQSFHIDPDLAKLHAYGGLVASGWHTCAMAMRMMTDDFISESASLGSPGVDEIRWKKPVRPGDILRVRLEILNTRLSKTKSDRGIVISQVEVMNQDSEILMSMKTTGLFLVKGCY